MFSIFPIIWYNITLNILTGQELYMSEFAIEAKGLTKIFYPAKSLGQFLFNARKKSKVILAVDRVSIQIKPGELFVLMGPNGAGKSTLVKMFAGLVLPTEGEVKVSGYDVIKDEMLVKNSIGFLTSEERSFYWRLTGRENLNFFACLYNLSKD